MSEWWPAVKPVFDSVVPVAGPVVGFFAGWLTFEWTERRRRAIAQKALRRAVGAELRHAEATLSNIFTTLSAGASDTTKAAKEIRWFLDEGRHRPEFAATVQPDAKQETMLTQFAALPVEQIAAVLQKSPAKQQGRVVELRLPILESALVALTSGLRDDEIQYLCSVRWQVQLLSEEARGLAEMVRLTFTVSDPDNHQIVVANARNAREGYRRRASVALDIVRLAIVALG